jgi:hypothetical protein
MAKKPNRVPPSVVIDKAEEGGEIDLDLLIANKTFYQLVYKEAIDSISDAITSRSKTATLFELNKSEHYIEIDKPQWKLWRRQGSGINEKLYQGLELSWKLTGPLHDVPNTFNTEYGVADTNQRLVFLKDREMTGLKNYLTDYVELTIYSPYVKSDIKKLFGNLN